MAQGFQIQFTNKTNMKLNTSIDMSATNGIAQISQLPPNIAPGANTGKLYYEVASNDDVGTLFVNFSTAGGNPGTVVITLDPSNILAEYKGVFYFPGDPTPASISGSSNTISAYMTMAHGDSNWPLRNLNFVQVVAS